LIFDTDVLIWCFRGDRGAANLIASGPGAGASIISVMEMLQGARSKDEIRNIRRFFPAHDLQVIPVSDSISYLAANLIEEHALSSGLQLADAMIAATARATGSVLVTANVRRFRGVARLGLRPFRPGRG
jgi:predicted nucleic acid-binding protein